MNWALQANSYTQQEIRTAMHPKRTTVAVLEPSANAGTTFLLYVEEVTIESGEF